MMKIDWTVLIVMLIYALPLLILVGYLILAGYAFATYGGQPITDIPAWAYFIMKGGN